MGIHVYDIYIYIHMYNVSMISLSLHVSKFELENAANQVQLSASDMKTFDLDCSLMKKVPRYVQFFVNWSFKGDFNKQKNSFKHYFLKGIVNEIGNHH